MKSPLIWNDWNSIAHASLVAIVGYALLVLLLRMTGPRTMSKMTPLDFVLAVTLGSAFGRTITASDVSLVQAMWTVGLLIGLQVMLTWGRSRSERLRTLVDNPPVVLYQDGRMLTRALRRHRLCEADVHEAARQGGHGSLAAVDTVLLMREGSFGLITAQNAGDRSSVTPYAQNVREVDT